MLRELLPIVTAFFISSQSLAGVLCKTTDPDYASCTSLWEYYPLLKGDRVVETYPIEVARVRVPQVTLSRTKYRTFEELLTDLDGRAVAAAGQLATDEEFLDFLRKLGEEFNIFNNYVVVSLPDRKVTVIYRFVILPSGSVFVLRRTVEGEVEPPEVKTYDVIEPATSDLSPVILASSPDFYLEYKKYLENGGTEPPDKFFKEKNFYFRPKVTSLPPVLLLSQGKLYNLNGKEAYLLGELSDRLLSRLKTLKEHTYTDSEGNSYTIPKGTTLKELKYQLLEELASSKGIYTPKAVFLSNVLFEELMENRGILYGFNLDAGIGYLFESDGFYDYRIVYAGTPIVFKWLAEGTDEYHRLWLDPRQIYWNEPLRNTVVLPEKLACKFLAKENCKRFDIYVPAIKHSGFRVQVTQLSKRTGLAEDMVLHCLFDQVGSSVPDLDLSAVSFSAGEQNYLLVCDSQGVVEGLPKIPPAVKDYAAQVGQILAYDKDTGLYVYFDNQLRLPVPDMSCSEIKEVAAETQTPVYTLNASSIPQEIMDFVDKQFSVVTQKVTMNMNPAKGVVNTGSVGEGGDTRSSSGP